MKIFSCSWGYDQTNVDFYVEVSRKGDWVTLQQVGSHETEDEGGFMTGKVVPNTEHKIGEPFRRRIKLVNGEEYCKGPESYMYCLAWDGKPQRVSHYA